MSKNPIEQIPSLTSKPIRKAIKAHDGEERPMCICGNYSAMILSTGNGIPLIRLGCTLISQNIDLLIKRFLCQLNLRTHAGYVNVFSAFDTFPINE